MPDFDVQQIRRKAADAIALSVLPSYYTAADREMVLNLPTIADDHRARAALAVIVPAVTQQVRALHHDVVAYDDFAMTSGRRECSCRRYRCPTVRLLDELDSAVRADS